MKKYVMHWEKFTKITSKNKHTFSKNALILINCILISRYFNFLKYFYFFIFKHALLLPNHDIISINFKLVIQFPKCSITIHNHPTFNARITSKISEHERSRALTVVACERGPNSQTVTYLLPCTKVGNGLNRGSIPAGLFVLT